MGDIQNEQAAEATNATGRDGLSHNEARDAVDERSQEAPKGSGNGLTKAMLASADENGTLPSVTKDRQPVRRRLLDERTAVVHHFSVGGHEGYVMVGLYEEGQPGEIFIRMAKAGSTIAGLMDSFGIAISMALQYGVPLKVLCDKFSHTRFEPSGWSTVKEIGYAKSLMDYLFRWLALRFLPALSPPRTGAGASNTGPAPAFPPPLGMVGDEDAPACKECGAIMTRNGACYRCGNCGWTSGCS
jgi:ribonucleoside-diphosphate reductase alpha chain